MKTLILGIFLILSATAQAEQRNLTCTTIVNGVAHQEDVSIEQMYTDKQLLLPMNPSILVGIVSQTDDIRISLSVTEHAAVVAKGSALNGQKVSLEASMENGDQIKIECLAKK